MKKSDLYNALTRQADIYVQSNDSESLGRIIPALRRLKRQAADEDVYAMEAGQLGMHIESLKNQYDILDEQLDNLENAMSIYQKIPNLQGSPIGTPWARQDGSYLFGRQGKGLRCIIINLPVKHHRLGIHEKAAGLTELEHRLHVREIVTGKDHVDEGPNAALMGDVYRLDGPSI